MYNHPQQIQDSFYYKASIPITVYQAISKSALNQLSVADSNHLTSADQNRPAYLHYRLTCKFNNSQAAIHDVISAVEDQSAHQIMVCGVCYTVRTYL
jgi:hypothetical protein